MMRTACFCTFLAMLVAGARAQTEPTTEPTSEPAIDPTADQILRQCCDFLAHTPAFSVHAEVWKDQVLASGHKIQVTREVDLSVRRPDRFFVDVHAHRMGRAIWYDGKSLTVLNRASNLYAVADAPPSIDQTLDFASQDLGITVPLEDLAVSDPYASSMKHVTAGGYFGDEMVLGVSCRHLGFSTEHIDWQLWVADGPQPLPQKMVITYKHEDQMPQFIAIFSKWNLMDRAADSAFQFIPPPDSAEIPMGHLAGEGAKP